MVAVMNKAALPPARAHLVELMQELNYGHLEDLVVRDGEPVFDPPPRVVHDVKFCAENSPRPEVSREDFTLKAKVCDLFAQMEAMGSGIIIRLEVQAGLPFKMTFGKEDFRRVT